MAKELSLPVSTANAHIALLEGAGLLLTEHRPATRGSQKICTVAVDNIFVQVPRDHAQSVKTVEYAMPIGGYVDCEVAPSCGLTSESGIIGLFDDPESFYEPGRLSAQLLWFHQGYVEYRFPKRLSPSSERASLHLSFESCSEAPLHHDDWPSDITVWINGREIGMHTSNVTLDDLDLGRDGYITVRIGVRPDARHVGGLNLFGRLFGNYPQGLV